MSCVTPWLNVSSIDFSDAFKVPDGGFKALPSPNGMPSSVRLWAMDGGGAALEFDYPSSERIVIRRYGDDLIIRYGVSTKRIHRIDFEGALISDQAALHRLLNLAVEKFVRVQSSSPRDKALAQANCDALKHALREVGPALILHYRSGYMNNG